MRGIYPTAEDDGPGPSASVDFLNFRGSPVLVLCRATAVAEWSRHGGAG